MIGNLEKQYNSDDAERQSGLQVVRECCALTKPSHLPPEGHSAGERLPDRYSDIGTRGVSNIGSKLLSTIFPIDQPWLASELDPAIEYNDKVSDEFKQAAYSQLQMRDMLMQALLETSNADPNSTNSRRRRGFRSHKRAVLEQLVSTGDTLEHIDDNYRMRMFRRDRYVTRRDDAGDVAYHVTLEKVDALTLSDEVLAKLNINKNGYDGKSRSDREIDLYTGVEWNPRSKRWVVTQQIRGIEVRAPEQHEFSPYFSTTFDLTGSEHFGRGMVEDSLPSLRTINATALRLLEMEAIMSRLVPVIDQGSNLSVEDLAKPSGEAIYGKVLGGLVQDVAFLQPQKVTDYQSVAMAQERRLLAMAKTFLLELDTQPNKDRVTREQILRIAQAIDDGISGLYASISEDQQAPLAQRLHWMAVRDKIIKPMPAEVSRIRILTGLAAISREQRLTRLFSVVSLVTQLGEEAVRRLDMDTLVDVIFRYSATHETGLLKSKEQLARELQAQMQQQIQMAAAQQAVQTTGAVAETAATQLIQGQA